VAQKLITVDLSQREEPLHQSRPAEAGTTRQMGEPGLYTSTASILLDF